MNEKEKLLYLISTTNYSGYHIICSIHIYFHRNVFQVNNFFSFKIHARSFFRYLCEQFKHCILSNNNGKRFSMDLYMSEYNSNIIPNKYYNRKNNPIEKQ